MEWGMVVSVGCGRWQLLQFKEKRNAGSVHAFGGVRPRGQKLRIPLYTQTTGQPLILEFSNTDKKALAPQDPESLKKMLNFSPEGPTLSFRAQSLLEEFNHMFTVTFQSEIEGDGDNAEQCYQSMAKEKSKDEVFRKGEGCGRIKEIDFSYPVLAAVPSDLQQKVVKSEIFPKESCFPSFLIKKRAMLKEKSKITVLPDSLKEGNDRASLLPLQPLTCKNNRKGSILFFTSKATPRDSELAKKIAKKNGNIQGSTRALIEEARMIAEKGCIGNGNRQSKLLIKFGKKEELGKGGKVSVFQKLPSIR